MPPKHRKGRGGAGGRGALSRLLAARKAGPQWAYRCKRCGLVLASTATPSLPPCVVQEVNGEDAAQQQHIYDYQEDDSSSGSPREGHALDHEWEWGKLRMEQLEPRARDALPVAVLQSVASQEIGHPDTLGTEVSAEEAAHAEAEAEYIFVDWHLPNGSMLREEPAPRNDSVYYPIFGGESMHRARGRSLHQSTLTLLSQSFGSAATRVDLFRIPELVGVIASYVPTFALPSASLVNTLFHDALISRQLAVRALVASGHVAPAALRRVPRLNEAATVLNETCLRRLYAFPLPTSTQVPVLHRVFSTASHGASFANFQRATEGCGPAFLVLKSAHGCVVGGFIDAGFCWRNRVWYGRDCALFTLHPRAHFFRAANTGIVGIRNAFYSFGTEVGFGGHLDNSGKQAHSFALGLHQGDVYKAESSLSHAYKSPPLHIAAFMSNLDDLTPLIGKGTDEERPPVPGKPERKDTGKGKGRVRDDGEGEGDGIETVFDVLCVEVWSTQPRRVNMSRTGGMSDTSPISGSTYRA